ncbi:hypothetical protein [uncultured Clostridium sp.]|uniref:hypothetical protein n=1 Tax=uncultured Clostridium sp. TaxID=59620 RepID=UPI0025F4C76C|nr:hypothetical protein [uncultured Clostridium sp.]
MHDPYYLIPGMFVLVLTIIFIVMITLGIKFMKKGILAFDLLIKHLEKIDKESKK